MTDNNHEEAIDGLEEDKINIIDDDEQQEENISVQEARRIEIRKQGMRDFVLSIPPNLRGYDPMELLQKNSGYDKLSATGKHTLLAYLEDPTLFLILHGSSGLGKTSMAAGLAFELMRRDFGLTARYVSVSLLLNDFSFGSEKRSRASILESVVKPDILVLDDIGAGSDLNTDTRINSMQSLISQRWENEKYTIMTTNLSIGGSKFSTDGNSNIQEWFGESTWDRIAGSASTGDSNLTRVEFKGRTIRGQTTRASKKRF